MPVYEYTCRKCSTRFEKLLFGNEKASCPKCGGTSLEKLFSTFAAHGGASSGDFGGDFGGGGDDSGGAGDFGGGCGSCGDPRGPGSCAIN